MKECSCCKSTKPLSEFYARSSSKDGRRNDCKSCNNSARASRCSSPEALDARNKTLQAWRQRNKEKIALRSRSRYADSEAVRSRVAAANLRWKEKNPERSAERYRERSEHFKALSRERYNLKKDECLASAREWRNKNKEKMRAYSATRKRRVRAAEGSWSGEDVKRMLISQGRLCVYCRIDISESYHVDHIMPIALGGSNWPSNLQLLCPTCNLKKNRKHPDEFEREIGFSR